MFGDLVVLKGPDTAFRVVTEVATMQPTAAVWGKLPVRDPFDGRITSTDNLRAGSGSRQGVKLQS